MNLNELIEKYVEIGYKRDDAISKVAQDIVLLKISRSRFKEHITIKGGVVMHNISKDKRRATRDMDMDFIKYSLDDESIRDFINKLNRVDDGITIEIIDNITRLHHQDYDGKRINIKILDIYKNKIDSKLDIGVNKYFDIEQDDYCFDLDIINQNISLLVNSKEQIFVEKLKSLLKFGVRSTRYKDIFDFYYLINNEKLDNIKLLKYIDILIFKDVLVKEQTIDDIIDRISYVFNNKRYKSMLNVADNNWLEIPINKVIKSVLTYFENLKNFETFL